MRTVHTDHLASKASALIDTIPDAGDVGGGVSNPPRRGTTQPRPAPRPASAIVVPGGQDITVRLNLS